MALTLYNKLITSNRKGQAVLAGGASAIILAVSAYRHLEDDDREIDPVKITLVSVAGGAAAGLIWGLTRAARRKAGREGHEIARNAVKPVATIGLMATLQDMDAERYARKMERSGAGGSSSSSSNYRSSAYNYGSSSSESSRSTYPAPLDKSFSFSSDRDKRLTDYTSLPGYGRASDDEDDVSLMSLGGSRLMSMVTKDERSRSYDNSLDDDDDDDNHVDSVIGALM